MIIFLLKYLPFENFGIFCTFHQDILKKWPGNENNVDIIL